MLSLWAVGSSSAEKSELGGGGGRGIRERVELWG